jgi:UDP-glucose 4-epimerase
MGMGSKLEISFLLGMLMLVCVRCVAKIVLAIINVGSGVETSINELTDALLDLFGLRDVKPAYSEPRAGDIRRSYADLNKAVGLLGYKPKRSLKEGLAMLLRE